MTPEPSESLQAIHPIDTVCINTGATAILDTCKDARAEQHWRGAAETLRCVYDGSQCRQPESSGRKVEHTAEQTHKAPASVSNGCWAADSEGFVSDVCDSRRCRIRKHDANLVTLKLP